MDLIGTKTCRLIVVLLAGLALLISGCSAATPDIVRSVPGTTASAGESGPSSQSAITGGQGATTQTAEVRAAAASASCAGFLLRPIASSALTQGDRQSFGQVRAGRTLIVYGTRYMNRCEDAGPNPPPMVPLSAVRLILSTSRGAATTLGMAHPAGPHGSFKMELTIPDNAPAGPATIHDRFGTSIVLNIKR